MGIFKTIAEGGQIWAHRVRMVRQVARIAFFLSFASGIAFFACQMSQLPKSYYQAVWDYGKAQFSEKLPKQQERANTQKLKILSHKTTTHLSNALTFSLKVFAISIFFFLVKGTLARRKKHLNGQMKTPAWQVTLRLKLTAKASPYQLGSLPLLKSSETRHILVSGGTGSGKTNCFHSILPQIREQKQRAIIVDTSGEFVSKYFREGKDILFNPFDRRGVEWHPWIECRDPYDYKTLAQSFIPSSHHEDENFWRKAAQEVFCSILQIKAAEKRISEVVKLLLYAPLHLLSKSLQDTKAASFLDINSEKTSGSIRAVAASFLECLELFNDTPAPFSIRDWVQQRTDDSWLFLSSSMGQRASLTPLISAWFSTAMRSLLQMEPDIHRRLWFIADELPSLNRLKDLETCLAESRKFGGCAMLALQSPAQLEMIYGRELARIIIGNCATRITFSEQDPEIAFRISKTFGEKEMQEFHESISYGAHEMRDGVNLSSQSKVSPVVSPTEIQSLDMREAFIKLAGNLPITKIKFKLQQPTKICEPFLPKEERCPIVEEEIKCPTLDT